jgi:hypothetical protein
MFKSNYSYEFINGVLILVDLGGDKSLTNDMERALEEISKKESISLNGYNIIYSDSEGLFDGVIYDGGNVSFYSINTTDKDIALKTYWLNNLS